MEHQTTNAPATELVKEIDVVKTLNPLNYIKLEPIMILDFLILIPLVISILNWRSNWFSFITTKSVVIYFSFILFFGYWLIRIIFNPKYKEVIAN
jgi:hypothetical protein